MSKLSSRAQYEWGCLACQRLHSFEFKLLYWCRSATTLLRYNGVMIYLPYPERAYISIPTVVALLTTSPSTVALRYCNSWKGRFDDGTSIHLNREKKTRGGVDERCFLVWLSPSRGRPKPYSNILFHPGRSFKVRCGFTRSSNPAACLDVHTVAAPDLQMQTPPRRTFDSSSLFFLRARVTVSYCTILCLPSH